MGAGNVSIIGQEGTLVASTHEEQVQLLMTQGMTRSKAEFCLSRTWSEDNIQAENIDAGYPKEGAIVARVAPNAYGKEIPINSKWLETNHLPLK